MSDASWKEVSRSFPCPACGRMRWCTITPDAKDVKCMRLVSDRPVKSGGWLHPIDGAASQARARAAKAVQGKPKLTTREIESAMKRYRTAISDRKLAQVSNELGVSVRALRELDVGLDVGFGTWPGTGWPCFPMRDAARKPIGIRIRTPNDRLRPGGHRYLCVPGSRNGLFVPVGYEPEEIPPLLSKSEAPLVLLMPEGPTDVAAAIDMGFRAVGRPSCNSDPQHVVDLMKHLNVRQEAVVVADQDHIHVGPTGVATWPGTSGAIALCEGLLSSRACACVKFLSIKMLGSGAKDLRQWMRDGGTGGMIHDLACGEVVTGQKLFFWKTVMAGRVAGGSSRPRTDNPHQRGRVRGWWDVGWREGSEQAAQLNRQRSMVA